MAIFRKKGEDGGSMVLQNIGILLHCYKASEPRRPWPESLLSWKPSILQNYSGTDHLGHDAMLPPASPWIWR